MNSKSVDAREARVYQSMVAKCGTAEQALQEHIPLQFVIEKFPRVSLDVLRSRARVVLLGENAASRLDPSKDSHLCITEVGALVDDEVKELVLKRNSKGVRMVGLRLLAQLYPEEKRQIKSEIAKLR